ncbi:MAG: TetR family transcriptional regulator [Actinobacteria bacterium]|nr:TetR family transcriptional regulator [Actinomycetota bacterium]
MSMYTGNLGICQSFPVANRGRPPLHSDEAILKAAFAAFAASGFDAMSVRALNAELGLSHETISKRFGPKLNLFRAAVDYGVGLLIIDLDSELERVPRDDDLDRLRSYVRAFMVAASRNPTLGELLSHDGIDESERARLVRESGLNDRIAEVVGLLDRLHVAGLIRETRMRELLFLVHGAAAPLHFEGFSKMFDPIDGPVEDDELIHRMTAAIMRSMGADA